MAKTNTPKRGFVAVAENEPATLVSLEEASEKAKTNGKPVRVKRADSNQNIIEFQSDGSKVRLIEKRTYRHVVRAAPAETNESPAIEAAPAETNESPAIEAAPAETNESPADAPAIEAASAETEGGPQGGAKQRSESSKRNDLLNRQLAELKKRRQQGKIERELETQEFVQASVVIGNGEIQAPEGHRSEFGRLVLKHKAAPVKGKRGIYTAPEDKKVLDALIADLKAEGFAVADVP